MTSGAISTAPLGSLIDRGHKPREPASDDEVWNLNLDQIEPHTGRVLSKSMLSARELGPSTHTFDRGTVLYSKLRPYLNKVVVADDDGVATTELVPIRCDESRLNAHYLAHFLRGPVFLRFATNVVAGAKMPRMVMSEFWKFPVPLPPLPEQRRIAAILEQADELRAKRREALAQLDSLTQSIFIEMFGNPSRNPKSWLETALSKLVREGDSINYGVVQPGDALDEGIPLVRVGDLVDGEFSSTTLKRIDPIIESAYKRSRLRGDEILVSCVGSIGVTVLATLAMKGFNIARAVARIPLADRANRIFIASYLRTDAVQNYFTAALRTVAQPTLNIKQIAETKVFCPPLALQENFATRIQAVESLKATHRAALAELEALFASLQHRAFAGQLS